MYNLNLIKALEEKYGSPMYVLRQDDFINNYKHFVSCFEKRYPKYQLSYSYKTNYTPYICKIVKSLGGYAEVVSDMECTVAKRIGYTDDHIIYNGPYKGELSFDFFKNGGLLNVDNLEELRTLIGIANENSGKQFHIGLRVNINIGQSFISRFGIDADSDDLQKAFDMVKAVPNLEVIGLHCHVRQSRTVQAWKNRAEIMLALADRYFTDYPPRYIDMGSGMFAVMNPVLAEQFECDIPTFDDYADAVAIPFNEHYKNLPFEQKPILFTEPGTTLINSYIDFIGKATAIKNIKGQDIVGFNCSKDNLGDICKMKQLPITVVEAGREQETLSNANFVGYTCLEHDVMYHGFNGKIAVGDYVVFENIGSYSNVRKPPFISQNCVMIAIDKDGNTKVMKKAETFDDVFCTYEF